MTRTELPQPTLLVGYGRMGQSLAAIIRDHVDALDIVGVVDPRPDLDELLAHDFAGTVRGFAQLGSAIANTGARSCLIASPTWMHAEHVTEALDASLDVFCEKPLTLDPTESDDLGARARTAGRALQVGFYRRFSPPWIAAKQVLQSHELGTPVLLRATSFDSSMPPLSFANPAVSGGLAIDNGVHEYDSLSWLLESEIVTVQAHRGPDPEGSLTSVGDEACVIAVVTFASGALASIELTRALGASSSTGLEIVGTSGHLRIDVDGRRAVVRVTTESGVRVVTGSETSDYWTAGIRGELEFFARGLGSSGDAGPSSADSAASVRVGNRVTVALAPPHSRDEANGSVVRPS